MRRFLGWIKKKEHTQQKVNGFIQLHVFRSDSLHENVIRA